MQKWDYIVGERHNDNDKFRVHLAGKQYQDASTMLKAAGDMGYELVDVSSFIASEKPRFQTFVTTGTIAEYFYFKRPKE